MSRQDGLSRWTATVSTHPPHPSRPHAAVLALWSYGIVLAQGCGLATVAALVAGLLGERENTAPRGGGRALFRAPLALGAGLVAPDERLLALALDASSPGDRFVVLALSVAYRGCALPAA